MFGFWIFGTFYLIQHKKYGGWMLSAKKRRLESSVEHFQLKNLKIKKNYKRRERDSSSPFLS